MRKQKKSAPFNPDKIPCQEISDPAVLSKTPLVSVKMMTYNHDSYIAQAIEGVLMQKSDFPIELVIGEDCSTDGTRAIVLEYQRKRPDIIRVLISDKNVGRHRNGLRTTEACRGKYIAWCEGDDYWIYPKKLQMQVDYLESHPDCGLVHSDYSIVDSVGRQLALSADYRWGRNRELGDNAFSEIVTKARAIGTCTACARRLLALRSMAENAEIFYDPHTGNQEQMGDLQIWLGLAVISRLHYHPVQLSAYRRTDGTASRPRSLIARSAFRLSSARVRARFARKHDCPEDIERVAIRSYCRAAINHAFISGDQKLMENALIDLSGVGLQPSKREAIKAQILRNRWIWKMVVPYVTYKTRSRTDKKRRDLAAFASGPVTVQPNSFLAADSASESTQEPVGLNDRPTSSGHTH